MEQTATSPKPFNWLSILPMAWAVLGVVLSVGITYGVTSKSISNIEERQKQSVTREEFQLYIQSTDKKMEVYMNSTVRELTNINDNISDLRKEVREQR